MAITATISTNPKSGAIGERIAVALVVSNSGGSDVTVTDIVPVVTPYGSTGRTAPAAIGTPFLGPGSTKTVTAGGSRTFTWDIALLAPSPEGLSTYYSYYSISAVVTTSDGSVTVPTADAIVGVTSGAQSEHAGLVWFNQFESGGRLAAL